MQTATETYSPEEIFEAFLYEQNSRDRTEWQKYDKKVHRAFYQAQKEFPDVMQTYDFLLRAEPYSHTLETMFWKFRQSRTLTTEDEKIRIRNPEHLREPDEKLGKVAKYICDLV